MAYVLLIQQEALLEIQEAFDWYEDQKNGLGHELLDEIEVCYTKISAHPERYGYINQDYRRIKTNRFPYILVFEIDGNNIVVNSVRHIKRQPR